MAEAAEWPLVQDDEAGAIHVLVDAFSGLDDRQIHRVLEWARDRYDRPLERATTMLVDRLAAAHEAIDNVLEHCPVCKGTGELAENENGYCAICPLCGPLRQVWPFDPPPDDPSR